ncbi:MAG: hypothetical protein NTV01_13655 [Bacteroidia bacterium]|nr:hypothetical protein [Bacteroidia bacterium]
MTNLRFLPLLFISISACTPNNQEERLTREAVDKAWTTGMTLESPTFKKLATLMPLFAEQPVIADKGYNVLIDMAHECSFATLWDLPERLNKSGYRAIGSHATVNTVLDPKGFSRVRVLYDTVNKVYPFAWWPNAKYDVIITEQSTPKAQDYTDTEIAAIVQFVRKGGGLLIQGNAVRRGGPASSPVVTPVVKAGEHVGPPLQTEWTLNKLASAFGGRFTDQDTTISGIRWAKMDLSKEWTPVERDKSVSAPRDVVAMRKFGKGRVIMCGNLSAIRKGGKDSPERKAFADSLLSTLMTALTEFQKPVRGTLRLPQTMEGGGAIYPELEDNFSNIVFYYAANQKPELLKTVKDDVPKAQAFIQQRLPSTPTAEPMYLILCAGGGGGWAVNIYRPKENGIISLDGHGILSIFGHELAHTMFGPANDDGKIAGIAPIPDRGEAHAGWFQGKVNALFKPDLLDKANRECNSMFVYDPKGNAMDLATCYENEAMNQKWGYAKDWIKTWYIWQKIDDRYGPSWYPKWKWVQHTRWKDDPEHHLTWDEMVEDMSIAVGEDLFPFFIKVGTSLNKKRLEKIDFQGKKITLRVAPIDVTPAGPVRMEEVMFPAGG